MTTTKSRPESLSFAPAPARNPLYIKIGKRIRQARLMAKETNSRALSERLGWSGGRLNNFETGVSTPGVEETLQLCETLNVDPCWITYGAGSPRPASMQATRHRNWLTLVEETEADGELEGLLAVTGLTLEKLEKLRACPFKPIPDRLARQCEKRRGKPRGWLDRPQGEPGCQVPLSQEAQDLLALHERLSQDDRRKLRVMIDLLLGDSVSGG